MFKPSLHRIVVKPFDPLDADDRIKSARSAGIVVELDKREQKATTIGVILSVGSTCYKEFGSNPADEGICVGAKVLYAKYAGSPIPNEENIILNDEDILGVYTDD